MVEHARKLDPSVAVLAMSGNASFGNRAHDLRAKFLQKPVEARWLVEFVRDALHPKRVVRVAVKRVLDRWSTNYRLTDSESAILSAAAVKGISRHELTRFLKKSEDTVKTQIKNLLAKTGHRLLSDATDAMLREALGRRH